MTRHFFKQSCSSGNKPGFVDYAIWPFVERFVVMKKLFPSAIDYFAAKKSLAKFEQWRLKMEDDDSVKIFYLNTEDHTKYIQNRRDLSQGQVNNIDYTYVLKNKY
jgi:hypothetical protein